MSDIDYLKIKIVSRALYRVWVLSLCLLITSFVGSGRLSADVSSQPNILFILADDLGWKDLGVYGNTVYKTPHLDRLAAEGMRFDKAYAAAHVCSPTRGSILTGLYPARTRITDWIPGHPRVGKLLPPDWTQYLPEDYDTIGEVLQSAGYRTAWLGKWHLNKRKPGGKGKKKSAKERISNTQQKHGFDVGQQDWNLNSEPREADPKGVYKLTRESIEFIKASRDQPWFVGLSHYAVHTPFRSQAATRDRYIKEHGLDRRAATYAAMVEIMDDSVGRIMAFLDSEGLRENTIVVFTSDNGGMDWVTDNTPLRGGKGTLYEGGTRVPLIVNWPGKIEAGSVTNALSISTDFFPTFAHLAGGSVGTYVGDGVNLEPVFFEGAPIERDALYWHYPHYHKGKPGGSVITGTYKLIEFFENGAIELYDLSRDPGEKENISSENPEIVRHMLGALHAWRADVGAQVMSKNPDFKGQKKAK